MKTFATFALSLLLLALWILGCAWAPKPLFWAKPGATLDELTKVKYACLREAQQEVAHSRSDKYSGEFLRSQKTNEELFNACMNSKGWFLSEVDLLATNQFESSKQQLKNKSEPSIASHSKYLSATMVVYVSKANLRNKPSTKADVIHKLEKGEEVQVIKQKGEWFQIELAGGDIGWCHKSILTKAK
jgi:hypothetical protein